MTALSPTGTPHVRQRKWDVIHACDNARQVADLLDAQATASIRAYVLSRPQLHRDSLLQSWNEVRKWRSQLDEYCGDVPFDSAGMIVHAHSFTAGMAAIRGDQPAVYDVTTFIDQRPVAADRLWLTRSLRAAEQFVLSQSAAVIVHSMAMRQDCTSRGVASERLFLVPHPAPLLPDTAEGDSLRRRLAISESELAVFTEVIDSLLATALLDYRAQGTQIRLLLTESASTQMATLPQADQLAQCSVSLSRDHHDPAIAASDLVIAANEETLISAMIHGTAALANDTELTRSVSPNGAGLVWSAVNDPHDRARRLTHLLREPDFRKALGDSARRFITETRSLQRVGKMYEEVYRVAASSKNDTKHDTPKGSLVPAAVHF